MRRAPQLAAVLVWVGLAAHDHAAALAALPSLLLLAVADRAPGVDRLTRWTQARRAPRPRRRLPRRARIPREHRPTGRPLVLPAFPSRPPPGALAT